MDYLIAGGLVLGLSSIFIIAWLGALLGRRDRPVGVFIDKHGKALAVSLALVHLLATFFRESTFFDVLDLLVIYIFIAMFVPLLRRLESKPESS